MDITFHTMKPGKKRFYRLAWESDRMLRSWWTEGGKTPNERVTDLSMFSDYGAAETVHKARDSVLRRGYCRLGDADAASGDAVLEFMQERPSSFSVDVSPDSRTLAVASRLDDTLDISLVDIATGSRRSVHRVSAERTGRRHFGIHTALFHPDGNRIVYVLDEQTRLLDPDTGHFTVLADVQGCPLEHGTKPSFSRNGERLVVFDADGEVRVLDVNGEELFATGTGGDGFCRQSATLSPSGRWLIVGNTKGLALNGDAESVFDLYDVDAVAKVDSFGGAWQVDKIGFDPTETMMVANERNNRLRAYSVSDYQLLWAFPHPDDSGDSAYYGGWDYSPDGTLLAIGRGDGIDVLDAETLQPRIDVETWPSINTAASATDVVISGDGTTMTASGSSGRVTVYKL